MNNTSIVKWLVLVGVLAAISALSLRAYAIALITTNDIQNGAVTSPKLAYGVVTLVTKEFRRIIIKLAPG